MNIILIGMRGSGKTTVGTILAKKLGKTYTDTDTLVVLKVGMSIPDMLQKHGLGFFRDRESEGVREIADVENAVIATGGGIVVRSENTELLKKNGIFIFLDTGIETLVARVGVDPNRPPLTEKKTPREETEEILTWTKEQ